MNLGEPIAGGNTAKIYLYDDKIYKIFNDYLPDTESIKEAFKQKYAYSCGLPVPEIYDVTKINGKQAIIMEYVKGETLGDLLFKDMEQTRYYLELSIQIQLKIHTIVSDSIEPMNDKLYRQIESANLIDYQIKTILQKKLDSISYKSRLCHGDFHLFNLIQSNNDVFIIDWVDSSNGDIRADVYRTYLLYSQFATEIADMYLQLYCKMSGIPPEDIFQWAPIIAGARLSENVTSENSERLLEIIDSYI